MMNKKGSPPPRWAVLLLLTAPQRCLVLVPTTNRDVKAQETLLGTEMSSGDTRYLYVILTSVPGSSRSQIKATLSGDF